MMSRVRWSFFVSASLAVGLAQQGCSSDSSTPDETPQATAGSNGEGGSSSAGTAGSTQSAGGQSTGGAAGKSTGGAGGTGGQAAAGKGGATAGTGGQATAGTGGQATAGTGGSAGQATAGSGGQATAGTGGSGGATEATQKVTTTNLVSDQAGMATLTDANLINPWGLAFNPTGPLWVANNHSGTATIYDVSTPAAVPLIVSIPSPTSGTPGAPSGQIFNSGTAFMGDTFILCTEDGTIIGWAVTDTTTAVIRADSSAGAAEYKGLASLTSGTKTVLLAADFHNGKVDVFDDKYAPTTLAGTFTDPSVPSGYAPYNILTSGTDVYIAFAQQDDEKGDDMPGDGLGQVSQFDATGAFVKTLVASGGQLNAPWGLAIAPANFGSIGGSLIVGDFGDGEIHAFDITTGAPLATFVDSTGSPIQIAGLWALTFGPGTTGAATNQLFFSAGPGDENHGIVGRFDAM